MAEQTKKCIICNGELYKVIDLGLLPNSNNLVLPQEILKVKKYPLVYYSCENCNLLQQTNFVPKDKLFGNYLYLTGASPALVEHFAKMSKDLAKLSKSKKTAFVIGSNDETEIKLLKKAGFKKVIGVDPSNPTRDKAYTISTYFTYALSKDMLETYDKADLITANNVFAHIPDPEDMMKGMENLIAEDGIISIEVSWLKKMVEDLLVESLYHEHLCVWSIKAMEILTRKCGLYIHDIIYLPNQHGGTLRFMLRKSSPKSQMSKRAAKLAESEARFCTKERMLRVQGRAKVRKYKFVNLIRALKCDGNKIAIYSVPAKMVTWLNYCEITNKQIDAAYDTARTKINKIIPMANIQIKEEKFIRKNMPNFMIVGSWNYWDNIVKKFGWYLKKGGKIINPLTLTIIEK